MEILKIASPKIFKTRFNIIMLMFPNLSGEEDKNTPTSKKL
jgi:hypothetical protein